MAENNGAEPTPGNDPQNGGQPPLVIQAQYAKDLSFEVPNAPHIYQNMQDGPQVSLQLDLDVNHLGENHYEVVLKLEAKAEVQEQVAFIAEVHYGAVVTVNLGEEHLELALYVETPRHLFPFARAILAEVTREGGFPPLMLAPVDFQALHQRRREQAGGQTAGSA